MACRQIVKEEVAASSLVKVARRLGISKGMVHRWVHDEEVRGVAAHDHAVWSRTIDVVVLTYTMDRLLRTMARLRREARAGNTADGNEHQ